MRLQQPVFLVGMMGAGKTRTGRRLADLLEVPFLDMDSLIANRAGMTIPEIFEQKGEQVFRQMERQWLEDFCAAPYPAIVSTGGGAPCSGSNHSLMLAAGISLWLQPPVEILSERLWRNREERPKIARLPDEAAVATYISNLLAERHDCYAQATITCVEALPDNELLMQLLAEAGALILPE